jgi:hypothetical protein
MPNGSRPRSGSLPTLCNSTSSSRVSMHLPRGCR